MRRLVVVALVSVALGAGSGCFVREQYKERRGRGDAPIGAINDRPADVTQMPDLYPNIASKCAAPGWRVFVTGYPDTAKLPPAMTVVRDEACQ